MGKKNYFKGFHAAILQSAKKADNLKFQRRLNNLILKSKPIQPHSTE
jgi:hypothetical protein